MAVSLVAAPTVVNLTNSGSAGTAVNIANTPSAGDVIVLMIDLAAVATISSVTGLGATWAQQYITNGSGGGANAATHAIWYGTGATASGNITVTLNANKYGTLRAFHVAGLTATTLVVSTVNNTTITSLNGPSQTADAGQFVVAMWYTNNTATTPVFPATEAPTGWTSQTKYRDGVFGNYNSTYKIPTSSASHQVSGTSAANATHFITQAVIGDVAGGVTGTIAATAPSATSTAAGTVVATGTVVASAPPATSAMAGTVVATGSVAASAPPATAAIAGTVVTTGTVAATAPPASAAIAGTVPTPITGDVTATAPSASSSVAGTVTVVGTLVAAAPSATVLIAGSGITAGSVDATAPAASAAVVGSVPNVGTVSATAPSATSAIAGDVTTDGTITGDLGATAPAAGATASGPGGERVVHCRVDTPDGIVVSVPLIPVTPLATSVPITRVSVLAPNLTADYTAHPAPGEVGAPEVIDGIIGYPQLIISGQNVSNLRGVPVWVTKWDSEAPFGDTVAAFEFPQLNPWDQPGTGDLAFLKPDAPVAIAMREEIIGDGYTRINMRRLWTGFLDARGNGLGEGEDYAWEAKGTFWQAQSQVREPVPVLVPTDIGVLVARTMNAVEGRRWAKMPETPIGITTMTRGSRDETYFDYVQALLSEAITDDLRQWTLLEVLPGVPRMALKPAMTTVHATVAYGTPGVEVQLRVDESTRIDRIKMRGIGPKMGGWANVYYPGIELLAPPPYPNTDLTRYLVLGTTDADTDSHSGVTDWQRRVDELRGFANPPVSGVMSSAWVAVIDDLQRRVGVTADGSLGPQTWNATFDRAIRGVDLTPVRLPMAAKPEAMQRLYSATGVDLGPNPAFDGRVVREIPIDLGPGKTKAQGFKLARKLLGIYGEPAANGQIVWTTDPRETDRTRLSHLSNIKVTGFEGGDRIVQIASKSVDLGSDTDERAYVVTTRVDERARDAMVVEDLLAQRRSAQPDPSRNPTARNKASRQVSDQRTPWDSESPCGVLRRTAVNGSSGLWTIVTVPFAEVGQLSGIRLHSTRPFALALFASLRITENKLRSVVGNPFTSDSPWRDSKGILDSYGIIEAWGEKGNACGYSPKAETDAGATFTGEFVLDTPVDYWTETVPYVSVAIFMRGGSGWISGQFIPAYES